MNQKPSIGRIVHYQAFGTPKGEYPCVPRAAVVTEVHEDGETLGLAVLNPTGMFFNREVKHAPDDSPTAGMWNWPPYVPSTGRPDPTPLPGPGRPRSDSV